MTTILSDGSLVGIGGDLQPFPKPSAPLSTFGPDSLALLGDRTISFAQIYRSQFLVGTLVNKLSRQISRLPLKLYKNRSDGSRERIRSGKLADLLAQPFARSGPTHLKQAITLPALVHGNSAVRKVRDGIAGPVVAFEPLSWSYLRVHRLPGGPVEMWETAQPGQPRFIDPDDVIHVAWRGLDGPIGVSPLQQLGTTLIIEDAAQRYASAMFKNGASPTSAVEAATEFLGLEPDERQLLLSNLRADVTALYAGPDNAGRPVLLPPGLKWNAVGHSAVEAELVNQRKLTREEIAACYDVPPPLIGLLERSTFNNITELHRMLYITVLGPWLDLIEETLQVQLIATEPAFRGDMYVEFDLSEVLKGDLLARSQALALQISHGILTIDEAREIENRPKFNLPETRLPLYPSNNLTPAGLENSGGNGGGGSGSGGGNGSSATVPHADILAAADAVAHMCPADVQSLLARSSGSVVEAIFDLAGISSANGHQPPADDLDED